MRTVELTDEAYEALQEQMGGGGYGDESETILAMTDFIEQLVAKTEGGKHDD